MNEDSLDKLRDYLSQNELDAVFVSDKYNVRYLSDFRGDDSWLLIGQNYQILITDSRYTVQARQEAPEYEIYETHSPMDSWFKELTARNQIKRIGYEADNMVCSTFALLQTSDVEFVPLGNFINRLRSIKTAEEIRNIKKAVRISDNAISFVKSFMKAGMTEKQVAWEIEKFMREAGSEVLPFDVIVASGPNAARPHHIPGTREIHYNEAVIIDIGARVNGYASDLTRTISLGSMMPLIDQAYQIVLEAQTTAEKSIKSGDSCVTADAYARDIITKCGFGKNFGHSLGHGIGLECHEFPRVSPNSNDILEDGMVFTVEPGIYIPAFGGVRIEDTVTLVNGSVQVLSQAEK
jgi:Xaa-Pro aminopeptidase